MEVCGTHTHAIGKAGLRTILPKSIELISGPGCPVCVTSQRDVERMILLAREPDVALCTFGDMIRVPGVNSSLEKERARGSDIRIVSSPLHALETARRERDKRVVFLAIGFETTAPGVASVLLRADEESVENFSAMITHKLVVPAMEAVLEGTSDIHGFLTPGHVSVIIGADSYEDLARRKAVPCVTTGFDPMDILEGIAMLLELIHQGRTGSFIQYRRAVTRTGNRKAWDTMMRAFRVVDEEWRGLGQIPNSGLRLRHEFRKFDAEHVFTLPEMPRDELKGCRCGDVLRGRIYPSECPLFGKECVPVSPVGPCMVSSEGSCAARYRYG